MNQISNSNLLLLLCGLLCASNTKSYPTIICTPSRCSSQKPPRISTSLNHVALSENSSFTRGLSSVNPPAENHYETKKKGPSSFHIKARGYNSSKRSHNTSQNYDKWLGWLGHKCDEIPIGDLPTHVLKDFPPAMNLYAKERSRFGAENAESLLQRILEESAAGNVAVEGTISTATFNIAIDAWAKSGVKEAGEHAERIFMWMNEVWKDGKQSKIKQDTISFTSVIDAWANSNTKGSAKKACAILDLMEKMSKISSSQSSEIDYNVVIVPRPNRVTYNICLSALARSRERNSAIKAEKLVERMEQQYKESNNDLSIKPDVVSYQSLIFAWSNSREWGAPQRAEEILKYLDDLHKAGDESLRPNAYCFAAAINAWSKSVEKDKVKRAWNILKYMQELHKSGDIDEGPNVFIYTSVLNTACYPCIKGNEEEVQEAKKEAFEVALSVYEEILESEHVRPNHVTYGAFLNACHRLLAKKDERRNTIIKKTFRQAILHGQVGTVVLQKLLLAAGQSEFKRLVFCEVQIERKGNIVVPESNNINMEALGKQLPYEWSKNVKGEKRSETPIHCSGKSKLNRYSTPLNRRGINVLNMRGKSGYYSK